MKHFATALLLCLCAFSVSCGDSHTTPKISPLQQATFAAQSGTANEQFLADAKNLVLSSFKITYNASFKASSGDQYVTVTWYKDGTARQRFDVQGATTLLSVNTASIFTIGYKEHIVVCSDELPATPADTARQGPKGTCCEDSAGCGDLAANMLHFLGFPLGFSASDAADVPSTDLEGVSVTLLPQRSVAGLDARCYEIRATPPSEYDPDAFEQMCFGANGAQLYWHTKSADMGEVEAEATSLDAPASDEFRYPYPVYTPAPEPHHTPVPPTPVTVRLRFPPDADPAAIDAALAAIRSRIAERPGCVSQGPMTPTDQCITTKKDGSDYLLTFGVSQYSVQMTDAELAEWLGVQDQGAVRLRFCEALQDQSGKVATIPSAQGQSVDYKPGTCEPTVNSEGQVQVSTDGASSWVTPSYADIATAPIDSIVWTPAVGDLRGQPTAMTDAYLLPDASFMDLSAEGLGWRVTYKVTDDGQAILDSIAKRLGPASKANERAAFDQGYPLVVFLDGQPAKDSDGHVAASRIWTRDLGITTIVRLAPDDARHIAEAINGPALQPPVQVVSVTRGQ
jgi:hypothetical protein